MVGQAHNGLGIVGTSPFCRLGLSALKHTPGEGQSRSGKDGRRCGHELLMEQGNLCNIQGHVLDFGVVWSFCKSDLEKGVDGGVSNCPVQGLQNVPLHLGEHLIIVERTTHRLQFPNRRYPIFLVAVLSGNEEGSAANELVVAFVDNTAGAVAVKKVDGKEKGLGQQLESGVSFNQKVEEVGTHKPLDLCLDVN